MFHAMKFEVLGPVRGWLEEAELDLGSPQQRAVLAMLLLARGRQVPTGGLVAGLWERDVPRAAVGTVRMYVSRLRQLLAARAAGQAGRDRLGGRRLRTAPGGGCAGPRSVRGAAARRARRTAAPGRGARRRSPALCPRPVAGGRAGRRARTVRCVAPHRARGTPAVRATGAGWPWTSRRASTRRPPLSSGCCSPSIPSGKASANC